MPDAADGPREVKLDLAVFEAPGTMTAALITAARSAERQRLAWGATEEEERGLVDSMLGRAEGDFLAGLEDWSEQTVEARTTLLATLAVRREELERARENTIAIEGAGIRWDEVDANMNYEGRCVAVKIERAKAEHAAQLASLREEVARRCCHLCRQPDRKLIQLQGMEGFYHEHPTRPGVVACFANQIRTMPLPDPTAALARVRAEAFEEAAKVAEQRGMSAEQTYGIAERAGCDMAAAAIRAKAGEARQVREADITPPAGEEVR